jgi:hypothetical protein
MIAFVYEKRDPCQPAVMRVADYPVEKILRGTVTRVLGSGRILMRPTGEAVDVVLCPHQRFPKAGQNPVEGDQIRAWVTTTNGNHWLDAWETVDDLWAD